MASSQPEKARGLPNPYAQRGLPNPYAAATVAEAAPVKFSEEQAKAEQKKTTAFHNPHTIKRPQPKQTKGASVKKPVKPVMSSSSSEPAIATATTSTISTTQQLGIDYWRSNADDDSAVLADIRERAREEKQRQKEKKKFMKQFGFWKPESAYKAEHHSNLAAYRATGAYRLKLDMFRGFLQNAPSRSANWQNRRSSSDASNASRRASSSSSQTTRVASKSGFAPPPSYDPPNAPSPSAGTSPDESGEDAYARRVRLLKQTQNAMPSPPPLPPISQEDEPPPPPPLPDIPNVESPPPPPPPPPPAAAPYNPTISAAPVRYSATISAPPIRYNNATISAPPVRYEQPDVQMRDVDDRPSGDERPAKKQKVSNAEAKLSKAERMMAKMGYVKGQGLGKNNDGITTHLEVKARKGQNNKRVGQNIIDDEIGEANIKAQQVFDIRGGQRAQKDEPGRFGEESRVVVAWGCVDGVDWSADADRDDGGIRQEMGDTFDKKFGMVERIHVNMAGTGVTQTVYIKFNSPLSALNAVNRFHEGYEFRDRKIRAMYYNEAKFEAGFYEH